MTSRTEPLQAPTHESETSPGRRDAREKVLAPYLEHLGLGSGEEAREIPSVIPAGSLSLELDPREQALLREHPNGVDAKGRPWPGVVAQGIAFRARCLVSRQDLEVDADPQRRAELLDSVTLDAAIGIAVVQEMSWCIERRIRDGDSRLSKRLSACRASANHSLAGLRAWLGAECFARAEKLSETLIDVDLRPVSPSQPEPQAKPETEEAAPRPAPARFERSYAPAKVVYSKPRASRRRVVWLSSILGLSILALAVLTLTRPHYTPPPELTLDQFAHVGAVAGVTARPPSLYLSVDAVRWERMSIPDRRAAMEQIAGIVQAAGYEGANVQTTEGVTVGRWSSARGATLVKTRSEAS
jgi:hypothetical protein